MGIFIGQRPCFNMIILMLEFHLKMLIDEGINLLADTRVLNTVIMDIVGLFIDTLFRLSLDFLFI